MLCLLDCFGLFLSFVSFCFWVVFVYVCCSLFIVVISFFCVDCFVCDFTCYVCLLGGGFVVFGVALVYVL